MPLFLSNHEQVQVITPAEAMDALADGLRQFARGDAARRPRIDVYCPTDRSEQFLCFCTMEGVVRHPGYYALRIRSDVMSWPVIDGVRRIITYQSRPGLYNGLVLLYSVQTAELLAIMHAGFLQHLRVAATAALGVQYLARPDAHVLGMLGSGGMARSYALAFNVVRDLQLVKAYSPNRAHLEQYCREMAEQLSCQVIPAASAADAAADVDIVSACTNAIQPVLQGEWIKPGVHVTNVTPWELDAGAYVRIETAGLLSQRTPMRLGGFADDDFAMRSHAMSYAAGQPEERARIPRGIATKERYPNARYVDCVDWETGNAYERTGPDEITTLAHASRGTIEGEGEASAGIQGLQFAAIGGRIYERAREKGLGTVLPDELFMQDIST